MTDTSKHVSGTHLEGGPDCEVRTIQMTPELMEGFGARTIDGYRVEIGWIPPTDSYEHWSMTATTKLDDQLLSKEDWVVKYMKFLLDKLD